MATDKRRVAFTDEDGDHLGAFYLPPGSQDCEDGDFSCLIAIGTGVLRGRSFARSCLNSVLLSDSDLSGCNFSDADLRGANLICTRLIGANLRGADLGLDGCGHATRLHGADLSEAQLQTSRFEGAQYDENTRFPADFDPQAAGMVKTEPRF